MRLVLDLLAIWTPLAIGVLMLLAGIMMPNAGLTISGLLCIGITLLVRLFFRSIEKSRADPKR